MQENWAKWTVYLSYIILKSISGGKNDSITKYQVQAIKTI